MIDHPRSEGFVNAQEQDWKSVNLFAHHLAECVNVVKGGESQSLDTESLLLKQFG